MKIKPIKINLQTKGPQHHKATTHTQNKPITLAKGDIKRVYNDLTKIMVSIGHISLTTANQIKNELFKGDTPNEKPNKIPHDPSMGKNQRRNAKH